MLSNRISSAIALRVLGTRFALTVTEWRVMAVLGRYPGLSANQVSQRTAMDKVAVSRAVARLLEAGRLERAFDDDDRRRSVLRPVRGGLRGVRPRWRRWPWSSSSTCWATCPADERALLFRLLDRLDELELRAESEATPD